MINSLSAFVPSLMRTIGLPVCCISAGTSPAEEEKRETRTPTIHKIERKGGHSENLRKQLIEEKTHHDPSIMITRNSAGHGSGRDHPAHDIAGVIEQL
jgi:hypothetical protein